MSKNDNDDRNDCQKDMDVLSSVRDSLHKSFSDKGALVEQKLSIAAAITGVVHARQDAELLQLRIWKMMEHDHGGKDECPDCGGPMHDLDEVIDNKPKNSN